MAALAAVLAGRLTAPAYAADLVVRAGLVADDRTVTAGPLCTPPTRRT
ncbi:hypothetical protein ACIQI7_06735 [Kitasatospora sp. NPDC092039]